MRIGTGAAALIGGVLAATAALASPPSSTSGGAANSIFGGGDPRNSGVTLVGQGTAVLPDGPSTLATISVGSSPAPFVSAVVDNNGSSLVTSNAQITYYFAAHGSNGALPPAVVALHLIGSVDLDFGHQGFGIGGLPGLGGGGGGLSHSGTGIATAQVSAMGATAINATCSRNDQSGCGNQSFNLGINLPNNGGNFAGFITLSVTAGAAEGFDENARALIDPILSFDADFLDAHPDWVLEFSPDIQNGVAGPGGVPEPASWALMILGFGLSGAALRRRRAAVA